MIEAAAILVGGKGTRLGSLTQDVPKPLLPIAGIPLLEHQICLLERYGVKEVFLLANHLHSKIEQFIEERKGIAKLHLCIEPEPLGTAGGLKLIEHLLPNSFYVLYGDVMLDMDLSRLARYHYLKQAIATLVVHPNDHPYDSDLSEIDENGQVTHWFPKPHQEGWYRNLVNAGLYVFEKELLHHIPPKGSADFGKDLFGQWAGKLPIYAYSTPEYLKDMGTPDRLEKVNKDFLSGKITQSNLEREQKAIFIDRDGVINEEVDLISDPNDLRLLPGTSKALQKINRSSYLAVLATNQSVVARNLIDIKGLRNIFNKMETDLGRDRAYLDAIYYCPHHPHGGFEGENKAYKIDCHCRKPKPGMLLDAARDFNINLNQSWFIGDADRDIQAGRAAGVQTVAVRTGKGLKDAQQRPDYFFDNLEQAVHFIIDDPLAAACNTIFKKISEQETGKGTQVVCVGGLSRSGKSTLASRFAFACKSKRLSLLHIHLDDWLLPASERQAGMSVKQRYRLEKIGKDLESLFKGEMIEFQPYHTLSMERSTRTVSYQYNSEQILLIDGVLALDEAIQQVFNSTKVYCHISEPLRTERLMSFYQWKGLSEEQILKKIGERSEEFHYVKKLEQVADLFFDFSRDQFS
jgi:D,D-heptose 1,7-bisphosphate phosphatase